MAAWKTWLSTIALSSGVAELVAARSGACEGMGMRQQWKCLRQFSSNDEMQTDAAQQIPCCDSSAALGMIRRKGSTRKNETHRAESVFLTTMERTTRRENCARRNE